MVDSTGPGDDDFDTSDADSDFQENYDDWRDQVASETALERDAEREMWEGNEPDSD
ncbi:MAG: hypothetical protein ACP5D7_09355 [Limnospira sp.]